MDRHQPKGPMTMNTVTSLIDQAPKYFLRTPEGRKGLDLPKDIEGEEAKAYFLVQATQDEAERVGWAILDEVVTHAKLSVVKSEERAQEVQEARATARASKRGKHKKSASKELAKGKA